MIIVFSGTDGAGKSTQIDLLTEQLTWQGRQVSYCWGRGGYTPGFQKIKTLARKLAGKKVLPQGRTADRKRVMEKGFVSQIWLWVAILDLFLYYGVYVRLLSLSGRVVICDRYLADTCIDFKLNLGRQFNADGLLWRILNFLAPQPDCAFMLYVPVEVSLERSKIKGEPFPDSPETLLYRLESYLDESLFPAATYDKIDCRQSIDEISQKISNSLEVGVA